MILQNNLVTSEAGFSEKIFESGILTEEQFKRLDEMNKQECFSQFCTVLEV